MTNRSGNLLRSVSRVTQEPLGDAEMLRRFVQRRDSAAFEVLVWRHGPAIYSACRRMLRDKHLAEDALQATFLLLSQKAENIRDGNQLAAWLHRTACRVCWRAGKKPRAEPLVNDPPAPSAATLEPDTAAILDAEVNRLPERFRNVVVLCYLENRSTDEAARMLNIPRGTVLSRLATARAKLGIRLTKQGLAPALAVVLVNDRLNAELVQKCVTIGCHSGVALATIPFQLAQGVLIMSLRKLVLAWSMVLVSIAGVGTGVAVVATAGDEPVDTPAVDEKSKQPSDIAPLDQLLNSERQAYRQLEGTWAITSIIEGGKPVPESSQMLAAGFTFEKLRIKGQSVEVLGKGKGPSGTFSYRVNPKKSPNEMTWYNKSFLLQSIYQLEDRKLTIAYFGLSWLQRPTSFAADDAEYENMPLVVLTYKRVKDEPEAKKQEPTQDKAKSEARQQLMSNIHQMENELSQIVQAQNENNEKLTLLQKGDTSPVLIDSKKAALVAVEQELVKAEVKMIEVEGRYELFKDVIEQKAIPVTEVKLPYDTQRKIIDYLKERREQLQKELIVSSGSSTKENEIRGELKLLRERGMRLQIEIKQLQSQLSIRQ